MDLIFLLLLLGAVICFGVAAFAATRVDATGRAVARTRVNFLAIGLLLWALVDLIKAFR